MLILLVLLSGNSVSAQSVEDCDEPQYCAFLGLRGRLNESFYQCDRFNAIHNRFCFKCNYRQCFVDLPIFLQAQPCDQFCGSKNDVTQTEIRDRINSYAVLWQCANDPSLFGRCAPCDADSCDMRKVTWETKPECETFDACDYAIPDTNSVAFDTGSGYDDTEAFGHFSELTNVGEGAWTILPPVTPFQEREWSHDSFDYERTEQPLDSDPFVSIRIPDYDAAEMQGLSFTQRQTLTEASVKPSENSQLTRQESEHDEPSVMHTFLSVPSDLDTKRFYPYTIGDPHVQTSEQTTRRTTTTESPWVTHAPLLPTTTSVSVQEFIPAGATVSSTTVFKGESNASGKVAEAAPLTYGIDDNVINELLHEAARNFDLDFVRHLLQDGLSAQAFRFLRDQYVFNDFHMMNLPNLAIRDSGLPLDQRGLIIRARQRAYEKDMRERLEMRNRIFKKDSDRFKKQSESLKKPLLFLDELRPFVMQQNRVEPAERSLHFDDGIRGEVIRQALESPGGRSDSERTPDHDVIEGSASNPMGTSLDEGLPPACRRRRRSFVCADGRKAQLVLRWMYSDRDGNCRTYNYPYCSGTQVVHEIALRSKEECEKLCLGRSFDY